MPKKVSFALPDKFDGAPEQCKGFIRQAEIFFKHQGEGFESEEKKCAFLMSLLTGKAINWATAVWEKEKKITDPIILRIFHSTNQRCVWASSWRQGCRDTTTTTISRLPISLWLCHRIQNSLSSQWLEWYCIQGCVSTEFECRITGRTSVQGRKPLLWLHTCYEDW